MAYLKNKEIAKFFNFTNVVSKSDLPKYTTDYVFDDERILVGYKTRNDYGIFTDSKIVLFDNSYTMGMAKQVFVIPYTSLTAVAVVFKLTGAEILCMLDGGNQLRLKFAHMDNHDKLRLRLLYTVIIRVVNGQKVDEKVVKKLIENDITFDKKKEGI